MTDKEPEDDFEVVITRADIPLIAGITFALLLSILLQVAQWLNLE